MRLNTAVRYAVFDAPAWLQGWSGVRVAYGTVLAPMLAGLWRGRAAARQWMVAPFLAAPLTVAAGLGAAVLAPALHSVGVMNDGLVQIALNATATAGLGYLSGAAIARRRGQALIVHQRGTVIAEPERVREQVRERVGRGAGVAPAALTLAGLSVPFEDETKHFKLIGTTGTGKSTAIQELLAGALKRGDRAIIADPDGGYLRRYFSAERGDVILNPFEARARKWDLFGEVTSPYDIEQVARSLIPDTHGSDRSWTSYARTFFTAVMRQTHEAGIRDAGELYRLLVTAETGELRTLVRGTAAQPFLEEHNGRMFDSIRSVTSSAVGALEYVGQQRTAPLSVRQWVTQSDAGHKGGVLFIPYQAGQIAALRSTISAWMRLAIFAAMDRPEGDQRLWFVIDELDALGAIDGLKDALARLRKFGGRCVLGFQSIGQVSGTYGNGDAQTIVENCGNSLILRCSSSQNGGTASFASKLIGQREVLRTRLSHSKQITDWFAATTRSEHLGIEPAVMDSEIEQLANYSGYLKLSSKPQWLRVTLPAPAEIAPAHHGEPPVAPVTPVMPLPSGTSATAQASAEARTAWLRQRTAAQEATPSSIAAPVAKRTRTRPGATRGR